MEVQHHTVNIHAVAMVTHQPSHCLFACAPSPVFLSSVSSLSVSPPSLFLSLSLSRLPVTPLRPPACPACPRPLPVPPPQPLLQSNLLPGYEQLPRSVSSMSLMRSTPSPLPPLLSASTSPVPPQMLSSTSPLPPQVNSSSPFPEPKHGRHFSSESTHSHSSAEDQRGDGPGMGTGTGTGSTSTHSSGCRSSHRERRSWQDLIETPLTSAGLHFLQTGPGESEYGGLMAADMYGGLYRQGLSPERRRQATLPVRRHHAAERDRERDGPFPLDRGPYAHSHTHRRSHKQRSQSLPRNRDPMLGKLLQTTTHMEERSEDEEAEGQAADVHEGEDGKGTGQAAGGGGGAGDEN